MEIEQKRWCPRRNAWTIIRENNLSDKAQLVFLFGSRELLEDQDTFQQAKKSYPQAHILGCSTAGEICNSEVTDNTLVSTAIAFDKTRVKAVSTEIPLMGDSFNAGVRLVEMLDTQELKHVFVLSEGLNVNGSELVKGINSQLPENVTVTGGLSGDADRFEETYVMADKPGQKNIVGMIALYGNELKVGYSSFGGWDPFGPERIVTKSESNILYELDGQSALTLYKKYLGEHADKLPASGLLFPLAIHHPESDQWVVRTLLAVDEEKGSLTFAGDVPQHAQVRLMKANFERLIDGALNAAQSTQKIVKQPDIAILISCVGRKLILKQRIEEEVEAVRDLFGNKTIITGFYSYGEISPFTPHARCELHNQTMTITTLSE